MCLTSSVGNIPRDAQSAGFSTPFTCRHLSGGNRSIITDILLPTKWLNHRRLPFSQSSTIVLSDQANTLEDDIYSISLTWWRIFVRRFAPQSSKHGIVNLLIGSTLCFCQYQGGMYFVIRVSHSNVDNISKCILSSITKSMQLKFPYRSIFGKVITIDEFFDRYYNSVLQRNHSLVMFGGNSWSQSTPDSHTLCNNILTFIMVGENHPNTLYVFAISDTNPHLVNLSHWDSSLTVIQNWSSLEFHSIPSVFV